MSGIPVMVRPMDATTLPRRLLDLQTEYARYDEDAAALRDLDELPARTREQIADEYGQALREFLADVPAAR